MELYKNHNASGVTHYEFGNDYIILKFKGNTKTYKYYISYQVEAMKSLAIAGKGLNTYINRVKPSFK